MWFQRKGEIQKHIDTSILEDRIFMWVTGIEKPKLEIAQSWRNVNKKMSLLTCGKMT